jgi:2-keto-4-pentenoate hydratase/2-oxohepta-3-ene-1,7-dioic acid hydratase in catechol pathway
MPTSATTPSPRWGPWIVLAQFLLDVSDLRIRTLVNGEVQQDSTAKQMIWTRAELVSYASEITRLEPRTSSPPAPAPAAAWHKGAPR